MRSKEFINERRIKGKKKKTKVKLSKFFYPGFAYYGNGHDNSSAADAGDGGGGESVYESSDINNEVEKFKDWAVNILKIKNPIKIDLSYDTEEAQENHHTGGHIIGDDTIWVYAKNRNLVDILRTVFHELVHVRQGELGMVGKKDSYPGSPIEAQADMLAGKFIKIYGKKHRNIFQ